MASGQATRMGQDKLGLPWQNGTILSSVVGVILQVLEEFRFQEPADTPTGIIPNLAEVRVVARKPLRDYRPRENGDQEEGAWDRAWERAQGVWLYTPLPRPLSETLRFGLTDLPAGIQGVCFVPGDQVGLEALTLRALTHCFCERRPDFLVPCAETTGNSGSPVFFHRRYVEELRTLDGEQGGRAVLKHYPERWLTYSVPEAFLEDVDTPEAYRRLCAVK